MGSYQPVTKFAFQRNRLGGNHSPLVIFRGRLRLTSGVMKACGIDRKFASDRLVRLLVDRERNALALCFLEPGEKPSDDAYKMNHLTTVAVGSALRQLGFNKPGEVEIRERELGFSRVRIPEAGNRVCIELLLPRSTIQQGGAPPTMVHDPIPFHSTATSWDENGYTPAPSGVEYDDYVRFP